MTWPRIYVFITIGMLIIISALISIWLNIEILSPIVTVLAVLFGVIYLNITGAKIKQKSKKDKP